MPKPRFVPAYTTARGRAYQGDARVRFLSEPDKGQANALNKGFALARGEVLCWLDLALPFSRRFPMSRSVAVCGCWELVRFRLACTRDECLAR